MKLDTLIVKGFDELDKAAKELQSHKTTKQDVTTFAGRPIYIVPYAEFKGWGTRAANLLERVFTTESIHYQEFIKIFSVNRGDFDEFEACRAVFLSAKKDYEDGYLFSVRSLAKAEATVDILDQAEVLKNANYVDIACILAGIALEIAVKELSNQENIPTGSFNSMNEKLWKKEIYNQAMWEQLKTWYTRRSEPAHGNMGQSTHTDADDMIKGVRRFIAEYL